MSCDEPRFTRLELKKSSNVQSADRGDARVRDKKAELAGLSS